MTDSFSHATQKSFYLLSLFLHHPIQILLNIIQNKISILSLAFGDINIDRGLENTIGTPQGLLDATVLWSFRPQAIWPQWPQLLID